MQKTKKRNGFTLTELAIVIAIIAVLVAVLVPTFVSLINKAENSADEQTVNNLNTALSVDEAENGKPETLCAVWDIFEEAGYNSAPTPVYSDNQFCWYKAANCIVIYSKTDNKVTYPSEYSAYSIAEADGGQVALCAAAVTAADTLTLKTDIFALDTSKDDASAHLDEFSSSGYCSDCKYASLSVMQTNNIIGVTEDKDTGDIVLTSIKADETNIVIPDEVTSIDKNLFKENTTIESIIIGSGVTDLINGQAMVEPLSTKGVQMYEGAFYGCTNLKNITIADDSNLTEIGYRAFEGCTSLESIVLPDSLLSIGCCAFDGCTSLKSIVIPDSVTYIYSNAFENCTSLESVTIGSGVTMICTEIFKNCSALTSVTFKTTTGWQYGTQDTSSTKYYGTANGIAESPMTYIDYFAEYPLFVMVRGYEDLITYDFVKSMNPTKKDI